mgnify:CR=1 FL=1
MREILFKAKRIDNGEWVEGFLYKQVAIDNQLHYAIEVISARVKTYKVDESTICQYTGLTDRNGNKIWEGDILVAREPYSPSEKFYLKYDKEVISFIGIYIGFEKLFHVHKELLENFEVIGNIFDNKELLEN